MGYLIADLAYLLAILCDLGAVLLIVEWLVHVLPGAWLNPIRRGLFKLCFPLLKLSDQFLPFRWDSFNARGLLTAFLLLAISRCGIPWLVVFSYSLRG
jgi:uncharacterized protein YggT (Ycf19 family)